MRSTRFTELGPLNTKGMPNMRSGNPGPGSECRLAHPAPVPINSVQMTFQYVVGYTPAKGKQVEGPTMSIWAQDVSASGVATDTGGGPVYQSPQLPEGGDDQKYSFDHCSEKDKELCYSPNVAVNSYCSACTGRYVAFKFENKDRNVQLLLPITLHIDELEWGVPFLAVLLPLAALYAGVGVLYGRSRGAGPSAEGGAWKAHPHSRHWEQLSGLVLDGVVFLRARVSGKAGYEPVDEGRRRGSRAGKEGKRRGSEAQLGGSPSDSGKEKRERRESKSGKSGRERRASKGGRERRPSKSGKEDKKKDKKKAPPPPELDEPPAAADPGVEGFSGALAEKREEEVHSSQAKIKIVSLGM